MVLIIGLFTLGASSTGSVIAQATTDTPVVTVTQLPSTVSLATGDTTKITVGVDNPTNTAVVLASSQIDYPSTVKVEAPEFSETTVAAGDRFTVEYDVTAGASAGSALVTTVLTIMEPTGDETTERAVEVATEVTIVAVSPTIELSVLSSPASMADGQHDTTATVIVRNASPYAFEGGRLEFVDSNDLSLRRALGSSCDYENDEPSLELESVAAGSATTVGLCVDSEDVVQVGKQTVGVVVAGKFATPGARIAATTSATIAIDVTVVGVTALSPLGAAALFLFPAIVPISVFLGLARVVYPRVSWLPSKLEVTQAGSAVWLVPAAALIYAIYWYATGTDLTRESNTQSIIVLYLAGMGLGLLAWGFFIFGYSRHTGRKRFKTSDTPMEVLERLAAAGSSLTRSSVKLTSPKRYILGLGPQGEVAVCPKIEYTSASTATTAELDAFTQAMDNNDAGRTLEELRKLSAKVTLDWSGGVALLDSAEPDTAGRVIGPKA